MAHIIGVTEPNRVLHLGKVPLSYGIVVQHPGNIFNIIFTKELVTI